MSHFHRGELEMQASAGAGDRWQGPAGAFIRDAMPEQHRRFFSQLPTLFVGSVDGNGQPWASVLDGPPGFVGSPDPRHLSIAPHWRVDDPLVEGLKLDAPVGLLGLEPHTRRRNRMNGTVTSIAPSGFVVQVDQSYGNCPRYIQARTAHLPVADAERRDAPALPAPPAAAPSDAYSTTPRELDAALDPPSRSLIETTDTVFIASAAADPHGHDPLSGVDVSHRGGRAGFVKIDRAPGGCVLTLPDYPGNQMFNTLGNLRVNPRAGLLMIDYERGDLLHLIADAEIVTDVAQTASHDGAQRLLRLTVRGGRFRPRALPLRWSAPVHPRELPEPSGTSG